MTRSHTDKEQLSSMFAFLHTYLKYSAQILLFHIKKKFVIEEKKYATKIEQDGFKKVIRYGIAFYKKECLVM